MAGTGEVIKVDQSSVTTVQGVGGSAQIAYAFAKGDQVVIDGHAGKMLDRMMVISYPDQLLGRVKSIKKIHYTFTMPEDGVVIFEFISDRGGTNKIDYTITREPATAATANYTTKVTWKRMDNGVSRPVQSE